MRRFFRFATPAVVMAAAVACCAPLATHAQTALGASAQNPATPVKDASMLKPPAGVKVAIIEWEDLECPACAHAFPLVHQVAGQYHIPIVRYDFQIPMHQWSHKASLYARYLQDHVNEQLATEYRREVFATQYKIASADDLEAFTRKFFADHHQQMPFVLDPNGQLEREVNADDALGKRMGLVHTPTIFVVTPHHYTEVVSTDELSHAIEQAEASVKEPATAARRTPARR